MIFSLTNLSLLSTHTQRLFRLLWWISDEEDIQTSHAKSIPLAVGIMVWPPDLTWCPQQHNSKGQGDAQTPSTTPQEGDARPRVHCKDYISHQGTPQVPPRRSWRMLLTPAYSAATRKWMSRIKVCRKRRTLEGKESVYIYNKTSSVTL